MVITLYILIGAIICLALLIACFICLERYGEWLFVRLHILEDLSESKKKTSLKQPSKQILPVLFVLGGVMALYLLREENRAQFIFTFVRPWGLWNWLWLGASCLAVLIWYFDRQRHSRMMQAELARIAEERDYWQGVAFDASSSLAEALLATIGHPTETLVSAAHDPETSARVASTHETPLILPPLPSGLKSATNPIKAR